MPSDREERAWTTRAMQLMARLTGRGGKRSERTERVLLGLAVIVFVVSGVVAWQRLPPLEQSPDPRLAAIVAVLGAAALAINAYEFAWSARVLGSSVDVREAIRVSTLASAANVLPIPGSVAIRTRALLQGGQTLGTSAVVTGAVGVAWVSAAAIATAVLGIAIDRPTLALTALGGGALGAALAVLVLLRAAPRVTARDFLQLAAIETLSVVTSGTRLYVVGLTLGLGVSFGQAMTVNLGGILSNVAGFLPGGLGLRELAAGAFGAFVGMAASVGVIMAVVDRLIFYLVLTVAALGMLRGGPGKTQRVTEEGESYSDPHRLSNTQSPAHQTQLPDSTSPEQGDP